MNKTQKVQKSRTVVTLTDIEIAELQLAVDRYGSEPVVARANIVAAAESVARGLLARFADGLPIDVSTCHTAAPDPMGFDPDELDCLRCLDKTTCIVGLHRVKRERPVLRYGAREYEPVVDRDEVESRVPSAPVLSMVMGEHRLTVAELRRKARALQIVVPRGTKRSQLEDLVNAADKNAVDKTLAKPVRIKDKRRRSRVPVKPLRPLSELRDGEQLTCRVKGVDDVVCIVRRPRTVVRWEVEGHPYRTAYLALVAACTAADVACPVVHPKGAKRAGALWGVDLGA